jgi:methionine biosynthesis protein MetW
MWLPVRPDLAIVASLVPHGARVLDLGCGDGELLAHLIEQRGCSGSGIESSPDGFLACVARGVPVQQADIDAGLGEVADGAYDIVVLSQTLQAVRRPARAITELVRVGGTGIVSFPNFGHWRHRAGLALGGRMPVSRVLPFAWHETPNIHLCTIRDFESLLHDVGVRATRRILLGPAGEEDPLAARRPNLLASGAVYVVTA